MNEYPIESFLGVLYLIVGVRLFRLGQRSGEAPERILSLVFAMWGMSYLLWGAGWILETQGAQLFVTSLYIFGCCVEIMGSLASVLFLRVVFRSREGWAFWLVIADGALLLVGLVGSNASGDPGVYQPLSNPFYYPYAIGNTLPLAWMAVEGLTQYVKSKKRLRLGLCSPTVCNRYLLIGIASSLWTGYYVLLTVANIGLEQTGVWSNTLNFYILMIEVTAIGVFWLVFLPPNAYRRWVSGEGRVSASERS